MNRDKLIKTVLDRERLRHMGLFERLLHDPIRASIYYVYALRAKFKPFYMTFRTLWNDPFFCDLPNGNTFLYYGFPEANLTNFFIKNLRDGDVFIDGGANVGFYSLLASRLVGENGKVHSFEPTPSTFSILEKNLVANQNTELNELALLDKKQKINFVDYGIGYNAFNSFKKRSPEIKRILGRDRNITIETTTIDEYCCSKNISPNYMKLDLEGSEYLALLGTIKTLASCRPIVSLEVSGGSEWKENIHKSNMLLQNQKYTPFSIKPDGSIEKHDLLETYIYDNLIYIPNEKIAKHYSDKT